MEIIIVPTDLNHVLYISLSLSVMTKVKIIARSRQGRNFVLYR